MRNIVFISYAREDIETAKRLYGDLKSHKINAWLDVDNLLPGQNWRAEIKKTILNSTFFIALLSSNSVSKRGYVQKELSKAIDVLDELPESKIFLIPARINECQYSHDKLNDIHWVDLFPVYNDGLKKILKVIQPTDKNDELLTSFEIDRNAVNPAFKYVTNEFDKSKQEVSIKNSFWGKRSEYSKRVITEQVCEVAINLFKTEVIFDEQNANWLEIPEYPLPKIWHDIATTIPLLLIFPTEYPDRPPIGFYLKRWINARKEVFGMEVNELNRDEFESAWKWYCVYIQGDKWRPVLSFKPGAWRYGDNLFTYFTVIELTLSKRDEYMYGALLECIKNKSS